jgi:hypothetical protein
MSASLTPGYVFGATEQVTNVKLGTLVSGATISNVDQTNIASGYGLVITAASAPSNTNAIWLDSSGSNTPKYYNGTSWVSFLGSGSVRGNYRNLKAITGADSSQWTVTADELVLQDANYNSVLIQTFNKTLDLDTTGAGGVSTGAKAANTIYHVWAIRKSSDGTTNLVAAITSKTLANVLSDVANSYDQGAIVSVIGTNSSSAIISAHQYGRRYTFDVWALLASGTVSPWTIIDLTPSDMTSIPGFVPNTLSSYAFGSFGTSAGGSNALITNNNSVATGATAAPNKYFIDTGAGWLRWEFDILTTDSIWWGSAGSGAVYLHGFELNKLF